MERDRHSTMKAFFLLEDAVIAITEEAFTPEIDMADAAEGDAAESLEYIVSIGAIATVGGDVDVRMQHSDTTGTGFVDVPDAEVIGGTALTTESALGINIPVGAQNAVFRIGSISKKQFQRLAYTEEAAVTAGQVTMVAILQDFRHNPQADQNS